MPGLNRAASRRGPRQAPAGPLRVGHKGAALLAEGNTIASFQAALAAGVDMIEFDVLSERPDGSGRLLLAHDRAELAAREPLTLESALEHLSGEAFAKVAFDVDVKLPGYSGRLAGVLRDAGLAGRVLMSSMYGRDLQAVRAVAPAIRLGLSVPRVDRDYASHPLTAPPALAVLGVYRVWLPLRAARLLRSGRFDAIMAHWRVVTPTLLRAVRGAGGQLFVWTVDEAPLIARLTALGVDGIISNDPRLLSCADAAE